LPAGVDEAVFLNERGEVCEGAITTVFADLGDGLVTPPLACGLLPGILRAEMLTLGRAREGLLGMDDLVRAQLFVGNALRGLIPARLAAAPDRAGG
jgi:4-amino-4-deoxychorismate lyase